LTVEVLSRPLFWLLAYIIGINLTGFLLMGTDKIKAIRHTWRIPEIALFVAAFAGGSVGVWGAMWVFRHKTKNYLFLIGIPVIVLLHVFLLLCLLKSEYRVVLQ